MATLHLFVAVSTCAAATDISELRTEVKELKEALRNVLAKEQMIRYSESDIQDLDNDSLVTTQALFESLFMKLNVSFN